MSRCTALWVHIWPLLHSVVCPQPAGWPSLKPQRYLHLHHHQIRRNFGALMIFGLALSLSPLPHFLSFFLPPFRIFFCLGKRLAYADIAFGRWKTKPRLPCRDHRSFLGMRPMTPHSAQGCPPGLHNGSITSHFPL